MEHATVSGERRRPYGKSRAVDPELDESESMAQLLVALDKQRPKVRGDCINAQRPCRWISCRFHLKYDEDRGTLKDNFPLLSVDQMRETCALDVADRGGVTLDAAGQAMNCTRERVRQIEERALLKAGGEVTVSMRPEEEPLPSGGPAPKYRPRLSEQALLPCYRGGSQSTERGRPPRFSYGASDRRKRS